MSNLAPTTIREDMVSLIKTEMDATMAGFEVKDSRNPHLPRLRKRWAERHWLWVEAYLTLHPDSRGFR